MSSWDWSNFGISTVPRLPGGINRFAGGTCNSPAPAARRPSNMCKPCSYAEPAPASAVAWISSQLQPHELALALALLRDPGEVASLVAHHIRHLLPTDTLALFGWDDAAQSLVSMYSVRGGEPVGGIGRTPEVPAGACR
jgi:hypothetical protein